jgi:photosystem II stability/assembly factor-like uncharacterized protein
MRILVSLFTMLMCFSSFAQERWFPHDNIPGNIPNYKPAYQDDYPEWAQMLYQQKANYYTIISSYEHWKRNNETAKTPIERYFKIWRQQVAPFVMEDGTISLNGHKKYYQNLYQQQQTTQTGSRNNTGGPWAFLGPKETFWLNETGSTQAPAPCPWQVNVYSFDLAPSNYNTLYCGTETGYVNKSTDNGASWVLLGQDYVFGGGVTAVAVHPADENTAYVAAGRQIHKTVDGGLSWTPTVAPDNQFFADKIIINPSNPDIVLAAGGNGVYRSDDAGNFWQEVWGSASYDIHFKPGHTDIIYGVANVSGDFQLIISTDGGLSFNEESSFPQGIADASGALLAVSPAAPEYVFAVLLSSNNTPLLYKGNVAASNWELLATGQTGSFPMDNWQGFFDLVLEVSPIDANIIFTGTASLYKSVNGGDSFTLVGGYGGNFPIHPDIQCMKLLDNGHAWVSTDGGFTHSTDNFINTANAQAKNNMLVGSDMWGFDQGWNEDVIVGGRYHNGNTAIADFYQPKAIRMGGAESPTGWVLKGKSRHVAFNDLGAGWILPETAESEPQGRFIFSKYPNMDEYGGRRGNLLIHPNYYEVLYLGEGDGFWKSADMGVSFELLHDFGGRVRFVQISYNNPDVIYADVVGQGLFRSTDGGYSWAAKPSLTSGAYGTAYWEGKLHLEISPNDADVIYACLQNGTWSADIGQIFKSTDGGDSWEDWTGSLEVFTKTLACQPDAEGNDLLYLFTSNRNGQAGQCYVRRNGEADWTPYGENYPAGMSPNHVLPFFRDSKIRVSGNSGVWENELDQPGFQPVIQPWAGRPFYDCMLDTIQLEDHSILNHENCSWAWTIHPEPLYIDDSNKRNPKVVLGNPGSYDITLEVEQNGIAYSRTIENMISTVTCPSVDDCSNPAYLAKAAWQLEYADSEEVNYPGYATMAFDDDPSTIWHTRWSTGSDPYPHEIQVDLGAVFDIHQFIYLPRQVGQNGRIAAFELYFSDNTDDWGMADTVGVFENTTAPQLLDFPTPKTGRYFRLVALSEVNGNAWTSIAELDVVGCYPVDVSTTAPDASQQLKAFPVPTTGVLEITLPFEGGCRYRLTSLSGQEVGSGNSQPGHEKLLIDLSQQPDGLYLVSLVDRQNRMYYIKVVKEE